ncbi:MAG: hypothetical protein IH999_04855 [Proteobacteria bacterium]|nr:hypothetical protein [Pseudomonadota bacterium]
MTSNVELRHLINLPPNLIEALGEVSARYGQIEHLLTMTIHRTAEPELSYDDAFAEVEKLRGGEQHSKRAKKSFNKWAIQEFGEIEGNERAEAFNDLIQNWAALAARRHDVIHCCWSVGIKDKQLSGTRKGKLLTKDGRPFGIKDIEELGDNLTQFVVLLNKATKPGRLSGPEKDIAGLPAKFSPGYIMPPIIETSATAAAISTATTLFTTSKGSTERSDD